MARNPPPLRSPWLYFFAIATVTQIVLASIPVHVGASIAKCFIAPMLVFWVLTYLGWTRGHVLVIGLIGCLFGDMFLELPQSFFVPGMGAFAIAHVCFILCFRKLGAFPLLKARPWFLIGYIGLGGALLGYAWTGLPMDLRPVVPAYACLLLGTASTSLALSWRAGIGGALFLFSDGLILYVQLRRDMCELAHTTPALTF
jgi:uncharacterized membrane protein YhhN